MDTKKVNLILHSFFYAFFSHLFFFFFFFCLCVHISFQTLKDVRGVGGYKNWDFYKTRARILTTGHEFLVLAVGNGRPCASNHTFIQKYV